MNTNTYAPSPPLSPFINSYRIIESDDGLVNRVLPLTSLAIAFRFRGQIRYLNTDNQDNLPALAITGLRNSARLINYFKDTAAIIVLFKETGASAFFKQPLHELFGESVSLDNFITRQQTSEIEEQLEEATNNDQRIAIIEQFLLSKLDNYRPDKLIMNAVDRIRSTNGRIKIKNLAANLYISQDAFEKRFRRVVGSSPKQFSSIVRMSYVTHQKKDIQSLTDIAFDAGYFDQAHFNKEFRLFTGQTPTDFFKVSPFW